MTDWSCEKSVSASWRAVYIATYLGQLGVRVGVTIASVNVTNVSYEKISKYRPAAMFGFRSIYVVIYTLHAPSPAS